MGGKERRYARVIPYFLYIKKPVTIASHGLDITTALQYLLMLTYKDKPNFLYSLATTDAGNGM